MPLRPSLRRASAAALAVALAASASVLVAAPSSAAPAGCTVSQLDVVAHPDDDLLFQSPDLIDGITAKDTCVTTAYLTVGDAGKGATYWQNRLLGVQAAYAQMAGVANAWTAGTVSLAGKTVKTMTLTAKPTVALVFFGLPDGAYDGSGFPVNGSEGLRKLDEGTIPAIHAIDGSGTAFTKDELTASLTALMVHYEATTVHAQDTTIPYVRTYPDHPDHVATARLTLAASTAYAAPHTLVSYVDYDTNSFPHNLTDAQVAAKKAAFYTYASFDSDSCASDAACVGRDEVNWLQTQYVAARAEVNFPAPVVTPTPTPTPTPTQPAPAPTPTETTAPPAPPAPPVPTLPGEQGTPKVVLKDATLTSKQFLTRGVSATFTGLTAGKQYRVAYVAGESGTLVGAPVTASPQGTVTGTWKPSTKAAPALAAPGRFSLRLTGVQTTVSLAKAFVVKHAAAVSWRSAHRTGSKVVLTVTAKQLTAARTTVWKHADVLFQKRVGGAWRTVAVDEANAKGVASVRVKAGTATWRAVVAGTDTVWSASSRVVRR